MDPCTLAYLPRRRRGALAGLWIWFIDWDKFDRKKTIDLAALEYGGRGIYANDVHFGVPENLIAPGKGVNMGDGWETRRRREPGNDWCVLALAHAGEVERIVLDTKFFKGNYPDTASIQAAYIPDAQIPDTQISGTQISGTQIKGMSDDEIIAASETWQTLLPSQKLSANTEHKYKKELNGMGAITHIRLNIVPDGGVSRLRLFGKVTD